MRRLAVAAVIAMLAGCTSFGPGEPRRHHVLEIAPPQSAAAGHRRAATLLLAPVTVSGFYETQDIAYSRVPGTRAYYQFHAWTERPGPRLTGLLLGRLDAAGSFSSVARAGGGVRGSVLLDVRLTAFYHDAVRAPGSARVALTAELTDPVRGLLLARRSFENSAPAPTYDAAGAVQAFNIALTAMLDDIAAWVEAAAPR